MKRPRSPRSPRVKVLEVSNQPSEELLRACAMFGLGVKRAPLRRSEPRALKECVKTIVSDAPASCIVLVTGPSGAGKSTLMRMLGRAVGTRRVLRPLASMGRVHGRSIIDLLSGDVEQRLELLARVGLGDATLLARSPAELSEGQRHRMLIAALLDRAARRTGCWILVDEFASTLDRITARGVACSLRRLVERRLLRGVIVVATAHEDAAAWLAPELLIKIGLDGSATCTRGS